MNVIEVTTWKNGNPKKSGAGYGIRVSIKKYPLLKNWKEINVGGNNIKRNRKTKFTEKCPEIRNKIIGKFLLDNKLGEWNHGNTYTLYLLEHKKNKFELLLEKPQ